MMIKKSILILAEGFEEKPYIEKIISFPCISKNYHFSKVVNLKGNGNIISRYQYEFQTNKYDLVLVFADADKGSEQFIKIIESLGERLFGEKEKGGLIFMFVNPVTMQVVLSHLGEVSLTHKSKKANTTIIKDMTGIDNYTAKSDQIDAIIKMVKYSNYNDMKNRIRKLSEDYHDIPSTNILRFFENFENDDTTWIDEINEQIATIKESSFLKAFARKLFGHLGGTLRTNYLIEGKNESKGSILSFRKATTNFQIDIDKPQAFSPSALLTASAVIFTKNRDKFYPWFD